MLWVDDETPYERPFVRISTSSPPVIPLFLTIPNGFASLETVYIATKPDTNSSKLQYNPLYTFEVLSQKWQFKAVAICRTNIYIAFNSYALSLSITLPVNFFVFFSFLSILMFLFLSTFHSDFWNFIAIWACALHLAPKLWSKATLIQIPTKGNLRRLCHNVHNQPVVVRGRHEVGSLPCPRRCHRPPGPRDVQGPKQAVNVCKKLVEEIYF